MTSRGLSSLVHSFNEKGSVSYEPLTGYNKLLISHKPLHIEQRLDSFREAVVVSPSHGTDDLLQAAAHTPVCAFGLFPVCTSV